MHYRVFTIPVCDPSAADELNRFLSGHRVLTVDRQFVANGASSFWTFCVEVLQSPGPDRSRGGGRKEQVDYKEVLPPAQFVVFTRLRECRKKLAAEEGLPAYGVCTNEQLAEMAKADELTPMVLQGIDGFGEAKAARYGAAFIEAFRKPGETPA